MCYAMMALAMDLIWGYAGILSLGHGLFFALGGYAMGMYLMREIGNEGQYRSFLAGLHGVPRLERLSLVLGRHGIFLLRVTENRARARRCWHSSSAGSPFVRASRASISRSSPRRSPLRSCCCSFATTPASAATTASPTSNGSSASRWRIPATRVSVFVVTGMFLILTLLLCRYIVTSKFGRVLARHPRRRVAHDVFRL